MTTVTELKDQVVTLYGLIAGITQSLDDYPQDNIAFAASDLPTAITFLRGHLNTPQTKNSFVRNQTIDTHLLIAIAEGGQDYPDTSAREAVETYMDSVPLFFAARQDLADYANSLDAIGNIVVLPSPREPGPGRIPYSGIDYWSLIFTMQVETTHRANQ